MVFAEAEALYLRAHRAVENEDSLARRSEQFLTRVASFGFDPAEKFVHRGLPPEIT
jgi:hypothetical protein